MYLTSQLIWISIGFFILSFLISGSRKYIFSDNYNKGKKDKLWLVGIFSAIGWILLGIYWFSRLPHYYFEENSYIKSILTFFALPLFIYFGYYAIKGKKAMLKLGYAIAVMGIIYLPFAYIDFLKTILIEHTAKQEFRILSILNINAELVEYNGVKNLFIIENPDTGQKYRSLIVLACTGIGSISVFSGIIAAVDAPLKKKVISLSIVVPIIYILNTIRNVFITTSYGYQLFPYAENLILKYTGEASGYASFFWADKVISQSLSLVVLVLLGLFIARYLPEVMNLLEETLEFLTGDKIYLKKEENKEKI